MAPWLLSGALEAVQCAPLPAEWARLMALFEEVQAEEEAGELLGDGEEEEEEGEEVNEENYYEGVMEGGGSGDGGGGSHDYYPYAPSFISGAPAQSQQQQYCTAASAGGGGGTAAVSSATSAATLLTATAPHASLSGPSSSLWVSGTNGSAALLTGIHHAPSPTSFSPTTCAIVSPLPAPTATGAASTADPLSRAASGGTVGNSDVHGLRRPPRRSIAPSSDGFDLDVAFDDDSELIAQMQREGLETDARRAARRARRAVAGALPLPAHTLSASDGSSRGVGAPTGSSGSALHRLHQSSGGGPGGGDGGGGNDSSTASSAGSSANPLLLLGGEGEEDGSSRYSLTSGGSGSRRSAAASYDGGDVLPFQPEDGNASSGSGGGGRRGSGGSGSMRISASQASSSSGGSESRLLREGMEDPV